MKTQLRTILPALATLAWGATPVYFYASGRMGNYLQRDLPEIALFGGLGMLVLGLYILLTLREKTEACDNCSCTQHHDAHHDHSHPTPQSTAHTHAHSDDPNQGPWLTLLFMLLPLGLAIATTNDQYSHKALMEKGLYDSAIANSSFLSNIPTLTREQLEQQTPQTADGYFQLSLSELYFSSGVQEAQQVYEGLPVQTEGRIADERIANESGTRRRLYRIMMTCCAADAMAVGISLDFGSASPPDEDPRKWFRISGKIHYQEHEGSSLPILHVENVAPTEEPYDSIMDRGF